MQYLDFQDYAEKTAWKVSKYRVFSGPYLDTFHAVKAPKLFSQRSSIKFDNVLNTPLTMSVSGNTHPPNKRYKEKIWFSDRGLYNLV